MKKKKIEDIFSISSVMSSPKRLLILEKLTKEPSGYNMIVDYLEKAGVPIGSSEVYKHINNLIENGMAVKKGTVYMATKRGNFLLDSIDRIIKTEPKEPEIRLKY